MQTFHFYNKYHYGDNILNLKFFYNLRHILKEKNIQIKYYYNPEYIKNSKELERYIDKDTLELKQLNELPHAAHELWLGNNINGVGDREFEKYYNLFYARILEIMNINDPSISTSLWQPEDYLLDIYDKLDDKYKNVDILVINSTGFSGQYSYPMTDIDNLAIELSKSFKVVTTRKIDGVVCTLDNDLMLQDIGAISTHVKYIFGIMTAPHTTIYNTITQKNMRQFILISTNNWVHSHTSVNFKYIINNNLNELRQLCALFRV